MPLYSTELLDKVITIEDAVYILQNPKLNIISILKQIYEGKCYGKSFIYSVNEVKKWSSCSINRRDPSKGEINVLFEVTKLVLEKDEVDLVKFESMKTNGLKCTNKHSRYLVSMPNNTIVKEGTLLPVRVMNVIYAPFSPFIDGIAKLYTVEPFNVFSLSAEYFIPPEIVADIRSLYDEINKLDTTNLAKFTQLIFRGATGKLKLENIPKEDRNYRISSTFDDVVLIAESDKSEALSEFAAEIGHYRQKMMMIKLLLENFPTEVSYKENSIVWNIINRVYDKSQPTKK